MSAEFKDFRGEITAETDVWLEARTRCSGRTRQEIVRELLHERAVAYLLEAKVAVALAGANGALPEDGGISRSGYAASAVRLRR